MKTQTIWKFLARVDRHQTVLMPVGARILTAQVQHGKICLWARVDPKASLQPRVIVVVGTGWDGVDDGWHYVSTVQMAGGDLVFHVFEVPSISA